MAEGSSKPGILTGVALTLGIALGAFMFEQNYDVTPRNHATAPQSVAVISAPPPSGSGTQVMAPIDVTAPPAPPRVERPQRGELYEARFAEADAPRCYAVDFPAVPPGLTREQVLQAGAVVLQRICSAPEENRAQLADGCVDMEYTPGTVTQMCYHASPRTRARS